MARARMETERERMESKSSIMMKHWLAMNDVGTEGLLGVSDAETQTDEIAEDIALLWTELNNAYLGSSFSWLELCVC